MTERSSDRELPHDGAQAPACCDSVLLQVCCTADAKADCCGPPASFNACKCGGAGPASSGTAEQA